MSKRLFQVLDEMNLNDENNETKHVQVSNHFVSCNIANGGGHVTIGVSSEVVTELALKKNLRCLLLVIDFDEYERLTKTPTNATE